MGTQLVVAKNGDSQKVDPELLENLDVMSNLDLIKRESDWGALEVIPRRVFVRPELVDDLVEESSSKNKPQPSPEGNKK